jgi:hypothetical protein
LGNRALSAADTISEFLLCQPRLPDVCRYIHACYL